MTVLNSRTLSVSIACPPAQAYAFIANPANLPKWATAFCRSVEQSDGQWVVVTPDGRVTIRFVGQNEFGVLDHYVSPAAGVEIYVPMRVVPNGLGSELLFTLFQSPQMPDAKFAEDIQWVQRDLGTLKKVLEAMTTS